MSELGKEVVTSLLYPSVVPLEAKMISLVQQLALLEQPERASTNVPAPDEDSEKIITFSDAWSSLAEEASENDAVECLLGQSDPKALEEFQEAKGILGDDAETNVSNEPNEPKSNSFMEAGEAGPDSEQLEVGGLIGDDLSGGDFFEGDPQNAAPNYVNGENNLCSQFEGGLIDQSYFYSAQSVENVTTYSGEVRSRNLFSASGIKVPIDPLQAHNFDFIGGEIEGPFFVNDLKEINSPRASHLPQVKIDSDSRVSVTEIERRQSVPNEENLLNADSEVYEVVRRIRGTDPADPSFWSRSTMLELDSSTSERNEMNGVEGDNSSGFIPSLGQRIDVVASRGEISTSSVPAKRVEIPIGQLRELVKVGVETGLDGRIEVELRPHDLGRMKLIFVQDSQGITVTVGAENSDTIEQIKKHLDQPIFESRQMNEIPIRFRFEAGGFASGGRDHPTNSRTSRPSKEKFEGSDGSDISDHKVTLVMPRGAGQMDIRV